MKATAVLITKEGVYPEKVLDQMVGFDEVIVKTECPNIYTRYLLALEARNDLIYVQDDDCIVDIKKLHDTYNGQITNFMTPEHYHSYYGSGITLVGWGTFFPKKMVDFSEYSRKFRKDSLFLSQTDRVFTYLNQPFNSIVTNIQHLPNAYVPGRMSTTADHWDNLAKIKERLYNIKRTI